MSDHYQTLGVSPEATPQEIEAAYRRNALERGWEDGFWRELRDAYDVLSDPEERARYDEQRDGARLQPAKRKSHNPIDRLFPNLPHGWRVPEVLLSGDHGKIDEWRREQSRRRTVL